MVTNTSKWSSISWVLTKRKQDETSLKNTLYIFQIIPGHASYGPEHHNTWNLFVVIINIEPTQIPILGNVCFELYLRTLSEANILQNLLNKQSFASQAASITLTEPSEWGSTTKTQSNNNPKLQTWDECRWHLYRQQHRCLWSWQSNPQLRLLQYLVIDDE